MAIITKTRLNWVVYAGLIATAAFWMLGLAIAIYSAVWWWYMPQHRMETKFSFNIAPEVSLGEDFHTVHNPIYAVVATPAFALQAQDYGLELLLEMPRSQANIDEGNFMVQAIFAQAPPEPHQGVYEWINELSLVPSTRFPDALTSSDGQSALSAKYMSILPFKTQIIELLDTIAFAPLYVLGLKSQSSAIRLSLLDKIETPMTNYPFTVITIGSTSVELLSSTLVWTVRLKGLPKLVYNYPIFSFFIGVGFIWFWEIFMAFVTVLRYRQYIFPSSDANDEDIDHEEEPHTPEPKKQAHGQLPSITLSQQQIRHLYDLSQRLDRLSEQSSQRYGRSRRPASRSSGRRDPVSSRFWSSYRTNSRRPTSDRPPSDILTREILASPAAQTLQELFTPPGTPGTPATTLSDPSGSYSSARSPSSAQKRRPPSEDS